MAEDEINKCHEAGDIPLLVGGSGFYLRALIKGMYESTTIDEKLKQEIDAEYKDQGIEPIINFLKENDPETMAHLHDNDHYRIIRAYEHIKQTGNPLSSERQRMEAKDPYDLSTGAHEDWNLHHIYLELPREEHWSYITRRTSQMIQDGLVKEVKELLENGFTGEEKPLKSIGYLETMGFIAGEFKTEEEFMERISISTRQLAKSQRTFFNKIHPKINYHPISDEVKLLSDCIDFIRE